MSAACANWSRWHRELLCALCALLALASGFLPEICVMHHPDGSVASVFFGVIVDSPTGEYAATSVYSPWPLCLLFIVGAWHFGRTPTARSNESPTEAKEWDDDG